MKVRPLEYEDLPLTRGWRNASLDAFFTTEPVSLDQHIAWFRGRPRNDWMFILEDGAPVAQFGLHDIGTSAQFGRLIVAPDKRGKGYGKAAVAHALDIAQEAGIRTVWLEVKADNLAAVNVYLGAGFREAGEAEHEGAIRMELAL